MKKFRFHLPGMVHLPISEKYMGCAFTQKIVKLSKMLVDLGHEVYLYGAEGSDAVCTEFIETHTIADLRKEWGSGDNRFDLGYDWKAEGFRHDINKPMSGTTKKCFDNTIKAINKRKKRDDFLLLPQGSYQRPISIGVGLWLTAEPGIGYRGSFTRFKAFESSYIMNFTYGSRNPGESLNGNYYDRVIPNYFEAKHFPFVEKKEDYFFFIGRLIQRKGIHTAIETARALDKRIIIAGQGEFKSDYKKAEFIGYVEPDERAKLMGNAAAVFVPSIYLEPFGGVNVEAQLCGTPAITTNFGAFTDTVMQGVTGFRCDTLNDFVKAGRDVKNLDTKTIRKHAERYLTDNVKHEYDKWFKDLYQLYRSAHEPNMKGWSFIDAGIS